MFVLYFQGLSAWTALFPVSALFENQQRPFAYYSTKRLGYTSRIEKVKNLPDELNGRVGSFWTCHTVNFRMPVWVSWIFWIWLTTVHMRKEWGNSVINFMWVGFGTPPSPVCFGTPPSPVIFPPLMVCHHHFFSICCGALSLLVSIIWFILTALMAR